MVKQKWYGVKVGKEPGVYETWAACQEQTKGFSGAKFQSFLSEKEAHDWVNSSDEVFINNDSSSLGKDDIKLNHPYAFVDGSFNPKTNVYGWGGFIQFSSDPSDRVTIQGSGNDEYWAQTRNMAGELKGAWDAIQRSKEIYGLDELTVYHDFLGIGFWPDGKWKAKMPGAVAYKEFVASVRDAGMVVNFEKVTAHAAIPGNEEADKLAKQSVGIV